MEVATSGMLRSDEEERRFLSTGVLALVTLPEATGDLLVDGAGASPDLERVMVIDASENRENGAQQKQTAKKCEKKARNETKASYRAPGDSRAEKSEEKRRSKPSKDQGYRVAVADRCFATVELSKVQRSTHHISHRNRFPKY